MEEKTNKKDKKKRVKITGTKMNENENENKWKWKIKKTMKMTTKIMNKTNKRDMKMSTFTLKAKIMFTNLTKNKENDEHA